MPAGRASCIEPASFGVERFTVASVLDRRADQFGDQVMMSIDGTPITFAQMRDRSCAAAGMLADRGVRRGDTVALFAGTCAEWVYFWLGAARLGAVSAAVNAANKGDFLTHALNVSRARLVVADDARRARLAEVADDLDAPAATLLIDDSVGTELSGPHDVTYPVVRTDADDVGALFFTSGTTGPSKAVATTWHYLFVAAATVASAWEYGRGDVIWTAMPLFHLSAAPTVLAPMLVGGTSVLASAFHPADVSDELRACGAAGFAGAGAMVSMLWNLPPAPSDAQLGIRFISAAPISAQLYRAIEERYRCRVVTMYGMTEAFPIAYKAVSDDGVAGTSGPVNPAFEVRIVDGDGHPVAPGVTGEIACRPRTAHVMSEGYVSSAPGHRGLRIEPHPEWFRTGDLGVLDNDQNLTFVDRAKDSLRRRGENVSSVELEQVVMRHPAVAEAAAIAVPSELGEDDILVVVALRPGVTVDLPELLDFCAARMPYFCVPRYLEVLDEIPKNVIGRVRKDVLRQRGLSAAVWDREAHGYLLSR
ncbi:ATP-dependent acyl-CoA ligase [Mycolicibacterium novocastrense]|uniref:AMP-binding protein n=1 Tax=Mycolicibacterium novocastrense TaxID=59813 RepID=UPI000747D2E7|nr:AMP-binding protein [Mycolicibacterium novocastrense]KUH70315.1 ATP-dependent acyl-CoA ligase [Mycolicibacterium novocastrense]KUH71032.1 ATP-dependent acyl-CoA ligase [Mycolicibacterium novocastrense]KUH71797.1 ATP-dependent acyl-CoA ligase [Mycolicibacterium novocastrense]